LKERKKQYEKLSGISEWINRNGPMPGPITDSHRAMGKHSSFLCLYLLPLSSQGDHEDK
jgi:hypothetical protein